MIHYSITKKDLENAFHGKPFHCVQTTDSASLTESRTDQILLKILLNICAAEAKAEVKT